jgi:restriction system protein
MDLAESKGTGPMARRQGGFGELLEFSATLPWKVNCALAVVSFLVFHFTALATSPATAKTLGEFGSVVNHQIAHVVAYLFQFIVPIGFLIGATVSFLKGAQRRALFAQASAAPRQNVSKLDWQDFERLVGEFFRRSAYQVAEHGGSRPDGGVDLVVTKNGQRYLVQCKHWRSQQVGVSVARELNGVVAAEGAVGGFVVTDGQFTREAREFARKTRIELIDGEALADLIGAVRHRGANDEFEDAKSPPTCPKCGGGMARKVAGQGQFKGQAFWSCATFPRCRGKLPI